MAQMATVRQVKTHEPLVWAHDGLIDLQVGRAAAQALNVDAPFLRVKAECLKSSLLAEQLDGVNVLVSSVVTGTGVALGVLVGHGRTERIEDGTRGDVLRGDEEDRLALTLDFLLLLCCEYRDSVIDSLEAYHNLSNLIVSVHQRPLHELFRISIYSVNITCGVSTYILVGLGQSVSRHDGYQLD